MANLQDQFEAAQAGAATYHLKRLETVWTGYLATTSPIPQSDVQTLHVLANEIDAIADRIANHAARFDGFVDRNSQSLDAAYNAQIVRPAIPPHAKTVVEAKVARSGSFSAAAKESNAELMREIPAYRQAIASQLQTIISGQPRVIPYASGDLYCLVGIIAMAYGWYTQDSDLFGYGWELIDEFC